MNTKLITIYIGRWNDRDYVYSMDKEHAKSLVKDHFAYGDPEKDDYAVGNVWVSDHQTNGWRIDEKTISVPVISVEIKYSKCDDSGHLLWQCPYCKKNYSEEYRVADKLPILLRCDCGNRLNYILGKDFDS